LSGEGGCLTRVSSVYLQYCFVDV